MGIGKEGITKEGKDQRQRRLGELKGRREALIREGIFRI